MPDKLSHPGAIAGVPLFQQLLMDREFSSGFGLPLNSQVSTIEQKVGAGMHGFSTYYLLQTTNRLRRLIGL
jgi:hypothetical protein